MELRLGIWLRLLINAFLGNSWCQVILRWLWELWGKYEFAFSIARPKLLVFSHFGLLFNSWVKVATNLPWYFSPVNRSRLPLTIFTLNLLIVIFSNHHELPFTLHVAFTHSKFAFQGALHSTCHYTMIISFPRRKLICHSNHSILNLSLHLSFNCLLIILVIWIEDIHCLKVQSTNSSHERLL